MAPILAGLHKGRTGFVLREENGLLHVLVTADDDDVSGSAMPYILPEFILFARSSCLWSGLPLPSCHPLTKPITQLI